MRYRATLLKSRIGIGGAKISWEREDPDTGEWVALRNRKTDLSDTPPNHIELRDEITLPRDFDETVVYDKEASILAIHKSIQNTVMKSKGKLRHLWDPESGSPGGNYYVGINEAAAFFSSNQVSYVGTSGLIGCCAFMVCGKVGDEDVVYVSHVDSNLTLDEEMRAKEFDKIYTELKTIFK